MLFFFFFPHIIKKYHFVILLGAKLVKLLSKRPCHFRVVLEWALMLEKVYARTFAESETAICK